MSDPTPPGNANDYRATLPPPGVTGQAVSVGGSNPGATADEVIHAGKKIGKYLIRRMIGRGGMGAVYEAMDVPLQRKVALKILPHEFSQNEEALKRFIREAQLAARLNHPNVVSVFDVGRKGSIYFIAMELVQGTSGQEILESGTKMDWREAARAIADVCRALAAAHEAGLLHRDVKPGNILWSQAGAVKLSDFGLAKPTQTPQDLSITRRDAFVGTPLYMSPEQCRNDGIDHRSDIYSLGATFYTFLTGKAPYNQGSAIQILFAHCSAPIPDVRDSIPDVPQLCTYIVQKAMAKAPEDRYQSAHEMRRDLEALLGGEIEPTGDLSTTTALQPAMAVLEYSVPKTSSRKWIFIGVGIAAGVVVLMLMMFAVAFVKVSQPVATVAPAATVTKTITPTPVAPAPQPPESVTQLNTDEEAAGFTPMSVRDPAVRHYITARRLAMQVLHQDDPARRAEAGRMMVLWFDFLREAPTPAHKRAATDAKSLAESLKQGIVSQFPREPVTDPTFPVPPEVGGEAGLGPDRTDRDRPGPPQRRPNRNQ